MKTFFFFFSFLATFCFYCHQPILAVQYTTTPSSNASDFIRTSCSTTLYPDLCYTSLSRYSSAVQKDPARLAKVAITVSLGKAKRMASYVSKLSRQAGSGSDPRTAAALRDCFSTFRAAADQIRGSMVQMTLLGSRTSGAGAGKGSLRFQMSNVQTWMSAALTNEETCTDGFEEVTNGPMKADVCEKVVKVKKFTSNALALVNSYVAKTTTP